VLASEHFDAGSSKLSQFEQVARRAQTARTECVVDEATLCVLAVLLRGV
jgi:hypothetical protein